MTPDLAARTAAAPARAGASDTAPVDTAPADTAPPGFAAARAVADAVLYEGYLLYPYRRSSAKNRVRWQFGVVAPRPWVEANGPPTATVAGSSDSWRQRTECLLEAPPTAVIHVRVRFLHLQHRSVQRRADRADFVEVDGATVGDRRYLTFDEAVDGELDIAVDLSHLLTGPCRREVRLPAAEAVETLDGATRIVRTRQPVSAAVSVWASAAATPFPAWQVRLVIENAAADVDPDAPRHEVLRRALLATHALIGAPGGRFVSLLDPPAWASEAVRRCENLHAFPVLAGSADDDVVLSAPIILYDHPAVAPESPGDLFDATEIDEILSLRTMTLTDEEKREARSTDPRAASIIDRVELIPDEIFARLHGAVRSLRPTTSSVGPAATGQLPTPHNPPAHRGAATPDGPAPAAGPAPPAWWDPEADAAVSPDREAVIVDGVRVARGARVRLRPRGRGSDAQDMFLEGRAAVVEGVFLDVDGARHLAVLLVDDPGADLHRWYGRHYYFAPDEVEVVSPADSGAIPAAGPGR